MDIEIAIKVDEFKKIIGGTTVEFDGREQMQRALPRCGESLYMVDYAIGRGWGRCSYGNGRGPTPRRSMTAGH